MYITKLQIYIYILKNCCTHVNGGHLDLYLYQCQMNYISNALQTQCLCLSTTTKLA